MPTEETSLVLPPSWSQVLEKVRRTLRKAEEAARKREADPVLSASFNNSELNTICERLSELSGVLNKRQNALLAAENQAQVTDAILSEAEEGLLAWLKALSIPHRDG